MTDHVTKRNGDFKDENGRMTEDVPQSFIFLGGRLPKVCPAFSEGHKKSDDQIMSDILSEVLSFISSSTARLGTVQIRGLRRPQQGFDCVWNKRGIQGRI